MATKTELQQALALKKENPKLSTRDAVMQVRQTESPTSATNQQVLAQNQAKVQSEIQAGTRPEVGFVSNAVQDLGGDVANRQNTRNVMTGQGGTRTPNGAILNADGTVTQTPESLAVNAGSTIVGNQYDQRTPEQKAVGATATPEQAAKSTGGVIGGTPTTPTATTPETPKTPTQTTPPVPTDKNGIFNALVTGQAVTPTNTPEYRKAKASYDTFQKFNGMSKQQFIDNIKQGQITTELNSQLASNPVFQEAKAEIDKINRANGINTMITNISQGLSGNAIATPDYFETISANLIKKYGLTTNESQNAFKQIVSQDEDVGKATKELSEINRQVAETTQLINDGYKEIRQKYQGKLSATQLIAYMDNRFRSATDTLNALNTQRQYVEADLKTATDMAVNEYNAFQKDLSDRNAIRNTLIQSELGLATKSAEMQMEADFARKQAEANLNDPATAIANVMAEYKKLEIPFTTTIQSRLAEFQASGKSLPDFLTSMTENIQASPAYKAYEAKKAGEGTSYVQYGDKVYKNVNGVLTETDIDTTKTKETKAPEWAQDIDGNWYNKNSPISPADQVASGTVDTGGATFFDALGQNVGTYTGNRGVDLAGNIGDPLFAGGAWTVKRVDTAGEQKGAIFAGGKGAKPYGNTVVMEDENGNEIRFSHLDSINVQPGQVLDYGVVLGTRGNTGHVLGKNGEKLTPEQLAQGRGAHVDIEIKDSKGRLLSEAEQKAYLQGIKQPNAYENSNLSLYRAYVEDGKLPSKDALKGLKMSSQKFTSIAEAGYEKYLTDKAKEMSDTYPTLDISYNPQTFSANSATQREKLNESVTKIGDIDQRISRLKELFEENGTEVWPTKAKAEMTSLRKQIILKAKEVENLGVLNGPDLGILEDLLPSTTGIVSGVWNWDANTKTKLDSIQANYRNDAKTKAVNYGARLTFTDAVEKELADSF